MRLRCIDHGESVTAKLNSASPPTFASPRGHGSRGFAAGEKSREMKREGDGGERDAASGASEGKDALVDLVARQLFPRSRLKIRTLQGYSKVIATEIALQ